MEGRYKTSRKPGAHNPTKQKEGSHIKDWPVDDRPREMLLQKGPETLSNAAVLAVLLRTGRKGQDAVALARQILDRFGGLHGLMAARPDELLSVNGLGQAKVAQILAAMELVRRQLREPLERTSVLENPAHVFEYLRAAMAGLAREELRLLCLNRARQLIGEEVISRGTVDQSPVYTREVVQTALSRKASAVILAHNHPNAAPEESVEDLELTRALVGGCAAVDIPVLDHVIIGPGGFVSMRQSHPELFVRQTETL